MLVCLFVFICLSLFVCLFCVFQLANNKQAVLVTMKGKGSSLNKKSLKTKREIEIESSRIMYACIFQLAKTGIINTKSIEKAKGKQRVARFPLANTMQAH